LRSMVSMMDILPGAVPLMVDVRQSGSGPPGNDTQSGPVRVRPAGKTSPMIRDRHIFTGPVTAKPAPQ
jgi:hypothetical protein